MDLYARLLEFVSGVRDDAQLRTAIPDAQPGDWPHHYSIETLDAEVRILGAPSVRRKIQLFMEASKAYQRQLMVAQAMVADDGAEMLEGVSPFDVQTDLADRYLAIKNSVWELEETLRAEIGNA